jgi:hypothetical protein
MLTLSCRIEVHDATCPNCGGDMPSEASGRSDASTCFQCQFEGEMLFPLEGTALLEAIEQAEKDREARRLEVQEEPRDD